MISNIGLSVDQFKLFDDTNKPGKARITAVATNKTSNVIILKEFDFRTTTMDYLLLTWGKAFGFNHPALQNIEDEDFSPQKKS